MAWVTELAATVGVHVALFSTYSAAVVAHRLQVPKLIQDGVLDEIGKNTSVIIHEQQMQNHEFCLLQLQMSYWSCLLYYSCG
jgi:hypothetical protein